MEYKYPRNFFSRSIELPITPYLLAATQQRGSLCYW
jgi:hypothetical protein